MSSASPSESPTDTDTVYISQRFQQTTTHTTIQFTTQVNQYIFEECLIIDYDPVCLSGNAVQHSMQN